MSEQDLPVVPTGHFVIGTVLAYGAGNPLDQYGLEEQGWMYCDGRLIGRADYPDLFAVIGTLHGGGDGTTTFNLPDYRGYLLRGVDDGAGRDPDAAKRSEPAPGGAAGDRCGSTQKHATGRPRQAFTLDSDGGHSHEVYGVPQDKSSTPVAGSRRAIWNDGGGNTGSAGSHQHFITSGGDAETRPDNAYVNFIIRYRT
ncbi:phage tail protein [Micromonospora sp. CPCC 205556]|uniref:phage tail protein n=1 Tax=Micromonospora sp. CPCC 205556 TaxID=3122398 RepID=UPI002FEF6F53